MAVNIKTYEKDPATIQVEMLPRCYVVWKGEHYNGHFEVITEERLGKLQKVRKFVGDTLWVPKPVSDRWTTVYNNNRPLCRIKSERNLEDSKIDKTEKPKQVKEKPILEKPERANG